MKKSKVTDSQIMATLEKGETGVSPPGICRKMGINSVT
jgi:hypothetical protein